MKFFAIVLMVIVIISLFFYSCGKIKLNDLLNIIVLSLTLWFIGWQSFTTEKIGIYQIIPTIDVNMVYDKVVGKTYFWFSNSSKLPGFVYLERKKNNENKVRVHCPLRIPPERTMRTDTFDFSPHERDKLIIYVSIGPALEKSDIKFDFEKSYTFKNNEWLEKSWSIPDPPFSLS
jgi:hypothetical protein